MSSTPPPTPASLQSEGDALSIGWSDGVTHRLKWEVLRAACPCATCRAKASEPPELLPVLNPEETQPIRPTGMSPVGNYAYCLQFSDGHDTGIYTLEYLYALGQESARRQGSSSGNRHDSD